MCVYGLSTPVSGHLHRGHVKELTDVHRTDDHQNEDNYAVRAPIPISKSP